MDENTYKKETAYTQRDEVKRKEHLEKISELDNDRLVFIDETGTDDNIYIKYLEIPNLYQSVFE